MRFLLQLAILVILVACGRSEGPTPVGENRTLRIALEHSPVSLDPRVGGNRVSQVVIRMLFEGLSRINPQGEVEPAMAQSVDVDASGKRYTFTLREACWSDGSPVTAHDFVYAWKKVLSPDFDSRFAYAFFTIKNAQAAKLGEVALDDVGVWAEDDRTLVVELEHPAPYLLDHLANPICAPVPEGIDERHPRWASSPDTLICNGTFVLCRWDHDAALELKRNEGYWDADQVELDEVHLFVIEDARTSLAMFEKGELDYLGEPFASLPIEAVESLACRGQVCSQEVNGLFEYIFNCHRFPFTSARMRRAFACALDRKQLVRHLLKRNEGIATSLLPPALSLHEEALVADGDLEQARKLFSEALEELGVTAADLPPIVITYGEVEGVGRLAQAVQESWQRAFDVTVELRACEYSVAFSRYFAHDYMVGCVPLFSWYDDPIYNLDLIKYADHGLNLTGWEDPVYIALLDCADAELDPWKRRRYLQQAEAIAMEAMPLVPIHLIHYRYLARPEVKGAFISCKGMIDLKWAQLAIQQP